MKRALLNFWKLLKRAGIQWNNRDPWRESAVIAYYAIFSLPGLLLLIITVAGYFFSEGRISGYINEQISANMGEQTAQQVQNVVDRAYDADQSLFMTIVGIATILFAATGVFFQFQKSLNFIWDVKADPQKTGIWQVLKVRLFSLGLIIAIAFLLLVSLVITTLISALAGYISDYVPEYFMSVFQILNFLVSFGIITLLFAIMFKYLPDAHIKWRTVWIGSVLTSLLFVIGKSALGIYFGKANPGSGYGAAGFVILILLWSSYSSMIVFFGAEFTRAYSDFKHGGKVEPAKYATKDKKAEAVKKIQEEDERSRARIKALQKVKLKGRSMTKIRHHQEVQAQLLARARTEGKKPEEVTGEGKDEVSEK
ncbi:MAG: YihY/virulence factor BrkB family protein [Mariniphaga sp.]